MITSPPSSRLDARFAALKAQKRSGLVTFITAGDPDLATSAALLAGLPQAGADVIELGMPFSDPMADGPAIQAANGRAFNGGMTLPKVLDMVSAFRTKDRDTPVVLMGYYNPIYVYGSTKFLADAKAAGVDGLIIVDLPPEEDAELCVPALDLGLAFIRLVTPTTDAARLPTVLKNAHGFLYYVSITGITGAAQVDLTPVRTALQTLRRQTSLPVAVGFGITTLDQVHATAAIADAVIVGSAIVNRIAAGLDDSGQAKPNLVEDVLGFVRGLSLRS